MTVRIIRHLKGALGQDGIEYEHVGKVSKYMPRGIWTRLTDGRSDEEFIKFVEKHDYEMGKISARGKLVRGKPRPGSLQWKIDSQGITLPGYKPPWRHTPPKPPKPEKPKIAPSSASASIPTQAAPMHAQER